MIQTTQGRVARAQNRRRRAKLAELWAAAQAHAASPHQCGAEAVCGHRAALEHVCLASCRRVTDVGMAVLTALPALRRVTLSRCPAVSEVRAPCTHASVRDLRRAVQ